MFDIIASKNKKFISLFLSLAIVLTLLISMTPTTVSAAPVDVVINGSFENGSSNWTFQNPLGPYNKWQISGAGAGGFPPLPPPFPPFYIDQTSPQDGSLVAWNGFYCMEVHGEFRLWQDVTIPAGMATLSWKDRIQKYFLQDGDYPHTYEVQIRDPDTNNVISTVHNYSIIPVRYTYDDTGWQSHSVDVSGFAGSKVRIYFVEHIPEGGWGPGQVEIDAVSLLVEVSTDQPLDHFLGYKVKTPKACDGGVTLLTLQNDGPTANIMVTTKKEVVFGPQQVDNDASFSFGTVGVKLGTNITITVEGGLETEIHTSCSKPIGIGQAFGDFTVVAGESLEGGPLETAASEFEPLEVTLADQFEMGTFIVEKLDKFYNPVDKNDEGINDPDTHLISYKIKLVDLVTDPVCVPCGGGVTSLTLQNDGPSTNITVTTGKKNEELFNDEVQNGGQFEILGTGKDGKLGTSITITVEGGSETEIHTSCSQPIGIGQTFGDFLVVAGESKDGGPLCPIIRVESQFGTIFVSIDKADRLLVPTAKSLTEPVDPLNQTGVDHYKGYKIKAPKVPKDKPELLVTLVDQFNQPKVYVVGNPTKLYVPVDKNGEGIKNPEVHLISYKIKLVKGEPKHEEVLGIYTNNQFGPLKLNTEKEYELLLPCKKILP